MMKKITLAFVLMITMTMIACSGCQKKEPDHGISSEADTESLQEQTDNAAEEKDEPEQTTDTETEAGTETKEENENASVIWPARYKWSPRKENQEDLRVFGQYDVPTDMYSFIEENMEGFEDRTQIVADSKDLPDNKFVSMAPGELRNSDCLLYGPLYGKMTNGKSVDIYADSDTTVLKDLYKNDNWIIASEFDEPLSLIGLEDTRNFYDYEKMEIAAEKLGEPSYIIYESEDSAMLFNMKKGDIVRYILVWVINDSKYYMVEFMEECGEGINTSSGMIGCMETLESGFYQQNCFGKRYDTMIPFSEFR